MSEGSNTEKVITFEQKISGPYIRALLNPEQETLENLLSQSSKTILDIGCGNPPRLSFELNSNNLWVGCDKSIIEKGETILIHRGETEVNSSSKLLVYSYDLENMPTLKPDVMMAIAPNPMVIWDRKIFGEDLKRFLHPNKKQYFIIALDHRTQEELGYGKEARYLALTWLKNNGFKPLADSPILDRYVANSGDIEAENSPMAFVRNFK